jgi:hypothetical protein
MGGFVYNMHVLLNGGKEEEEISSVNVINTLDHHCADYHGRKEHSIFTCNKNMFFHYIKM